MASVRSLAQGDKEEAERHKRWLARLRPDGAMTRELFALAWPIAMTMLGEVAVGVVDTKLVGGLGPAALGGVGLGATIMFLGYAFAFGAMRGVKIRTAHAVGAGRPEDATSYAITGVLAGSAFGVVVMLACRDLGPLLYRLGAEPEIVPYARDFLSAVTLGAPSTCALSALLQYRQAMGDSRTPMVVGIAGNVFNALFAWSLIYGHFGLPALGVRGGGLATATTETLELAAMLVVLARHVKKDRATTRLPLRKAFAEITDIGLPTGFQFLSESLAFSTFTVLLGTLGTEEIAAHQIALNIIRVSFLPGIAVSEATSVLVGRARGRGRDWEADHAVKSGLWLAVGFMAVCGVLFATAGSELAGFFSEHSGVLHAARRLLFVAAVFQILDAISIVLRGALRGVQEARAVAIIGTLAIWVFLPPSAWLLGRVMGLGALGGWIGFVGETAAAALLLGWRWRRGDWRRANAT